MEELDINKTFYYKDENNNTHSILGSDMSFYCSYDKATKTFIHNSKRIRYYLTPECND